MDDFSFKKLEDHIAEFPGTLMLDIPFPLRKNLIVHLVVPRDLTVPEVDRIKDLLYAVALPMERS